jgi:predicted Zn finger-like uncharacterized protein
MEITRCPKCQKNGGCLVFRPAGNSKSKYPYVVHYDSSKNSRTRSCYLPTNLLSKVEFVNSTNNQVIENYQDNKAVRHKLLEELKEESKFLKKIQPKVAELIDTLLEHHPKKYKEFRSTQLNYHKRLREIDKVEQDPFKATRLAMRVTSAWMDYLSSTYLLYIKLPNLHHLSKKQRKKILTLRIKKVPLLYDPKNKKQALQYRFVGIQCKNCGSWRIDEIHISINNRTFHCYACGKNFNQPLIPLI